MTTPAPMSAAELRADVKPGTMPMGGRPADALLGRDKPGERPETAAKRGGRA